MLLAHPWRRWRLLRLVLLSSMPFLVSTTAWGMATAAAAGSGASPPPELCVLVPRVDALDEGEAFGEVPTATPALLVVEPLQQVRIETTAGQTLWSRRAAPGDALPAPLPWPLPPLRSDQQVLLRLQPLGAASDAFAHVHLRTGHADQLAATTALITALGANPEAWIAAIHRALQSGDVPLAWALLYAPQAPSSEPLTALRQEVLRRGCGADPGA
jgi:hypothetical protein